MVVITQTTAMPTMRLTRTVRPIRPFFNPVPIIVVSDRVASVADGVLADVAPTVLCADGTSAAEGDDRKALVSFK